MRDARTLAIVPARRGSKRLPGKNTHIIAGKPLVQWSIEAALECDDIHEVLVTSDDPAVLELATGLGVDHVVRRPDELACDSATTSDVILHALQWLAATPPQVVCLLQPTSPLRNAEDVRLALEIFRSSGERPVVSVCELGHPLSWCNTLADGQSMIHFARAGVGRGPADEVYRLNGAIYVARRDEYIEHRTFLTERTVAYVMPRVRSTDIDDECDLMMAEGLLCLLGRRSEPSP